MSKKLTAGVLLQEVKMYTFFVHRYKRSHSDLRRLTRRMRKDGQLVLIEKTYDWFRYRAAL